MLFLREKTSTLDKTWKIKIARWKQTVFIHFASPWFLSFLPDITSHGRSHDPEFVTSTVQTAGNTQMTVT